MEQAVIPKEVWIVFLNGQYYATCMTPSDADRLTKSLRDDLVSRFEIHVQHYEKAALQ